MNKSQGSKRKLEEDEEMMSDDSDVGMIPDSSDDENDYDEDMDDESDFDEITTDFEINPCRDSDYHSIKNMINKLVPYSESVKFSSGEITDLIIQQAEKLKFGRSIRVDGTEDPYGFLSVFNFNQIKNIQSIQSLIEFLKSKTPESSYIDKKIFKSAESNSFISILSQLVEKSKSSPLGLVFNERFLNIPNELVFPLHQYIQYDIELLSESDKTYQFQNYLFISNFGVTSKQSQEEIDQRPPPPTKNSTKSSGSKKIKPTAEDNEDSKDILPEGTEIFQKIEDKYIRNNASAWMTWQVPYEYGQSRWTMSGNLQYKGIAMILPASKVTQFLTDLQEKAIFD